MTKPLAGPQTDLDASRPSLCVWCGSAKVLRCQLPRRNAYLAFDPDAEDEEGKGTQAQGGEKGVKLCHVCGLRADKLCAACRTVSYCSRVHQKEDWRAGHKQQCKGYGVFTLLRREVETCVRSC